MRTTKVCPICGREFEPFRSTQIYCSPECRTKSNREQWKSWAKRMKEYYADRYKEAVEKHEERLRAGKCGGCVWKTPGYKVCVMPKCLKGLGKGEKDATD